MGMTMAGISTASSTPETKRPDSMTMMGVVVVFGISPLGVVMVVLSVDRFVDVGRVDVDVVLVGVVEAVVVEDISPERNTTFVINTLIVFHNTAIEARCSYVWRERSLIVRWVV